MEVPDTSASASKSDEITNDESQTDEDVQILSVDKITVEKIVLETKKTREVLVTKSESSKKVSALRHSFLVKPSSGHKTDHSIKPSELSPAKNSRFRAGTSPCVDKKVSSNLACKPSKLPISKTQKSGSFTSLSEKRISPIKLTKCSSIGSLLKVGKPPKTGSVSKPRKVPPKVPQKPTKPKLETVKQRSSDTKALSPGKSVNLDVKDQRVEAENDSVPEAAKADESRECRIKISNESQPVATNSSSDASEFTSLESEKKGNPEASRVDQRNKGSNAEEINAGVTELKFEEKSEDYAPRSDKEVPRENVAEANEGLREFPRSSAQDRLEKSQNEIERLQQNLRTKIHASTVEKYKQKLPSLQTVKVSAIIDLNQNDQIVTSFDTDFLQNRRLNKELKIEEKQQYPDNADLSDFEKSPEEARRPKYSKKVLEIEKRWSGEYLDQNSSESSKSSYIEELGSISSHESIVLDQKKIIPRKLCQKRDGNFSDDKKPHSGDEILEDTVSTVDSDSCFEDRIKDIECDIQHGEERGSGSKLSSNADLDEENESKESTLKETSSVRTCLTDDSSTLKDNEDCLDSVASKEGLQETGTEHREIPNIEEKREPLAEKAGNSLNCPDKDVDTGEINSVETVVKKDGYATLIKEFTMDPGTSKSPKDEKKKKGLLRLLPGLFSPSKESRKDHKKDSKDERRGKRREDRHFTQHQQNGNYTRSPDTMNLNEDIKRNVKLDTSLNSSIIEERLNEIKQELFPEQGLITSTPDHFLQTERGYQRHQRSAGNSSGNYIAEEKWIDQNIISGSPDLRKFKQRRNDRCNLERKHSLQESQNQNRFQRNHGPTGRISAPPCERFLIRPRAIHPIDRPLPAIPQKVEFVNYENHEEMSKNSMRQKNTMNYSTEPYVPENYENESQNVLYENGNQYNLTPVSAQVKITRQAIVNQNHKAPLMGRSPKYSPTSQKSDYADSSYTPNSSQNEFSPSSSKSGEYYLYSPRNSSQLSNESFGEKREQIYENEQSSKAEERLYDETPTSDSPKDKSPSRSLSHSNNSEHIYGQRSPANIPLSNNLAKMRANVSDEEVKDDLEDKAEKTDERISSPVSITVIAAEATNTSDDNETRTRASGEHGLKPSTQGVGLRVTSPSQMQRMASPLTIVTNNIQRQSPLCHSKDLTAFPSLTPVKDIKGITSTPISTRIPSPRNSPCAKDSETSPPRIAGTLPSNLSTSSLSPTHGKETMPKAMSPKMAGSPHRSSPASLTNRRDLLGSSPLANERTSPKEACPKRSGTPTSPSNSFTPTCVLQGTRRSQPNDQILIASPKKDNIYDSYGRLELGCPDSPVPMADSPSQVLGSKQSLRQTAADRADGCKSPSIDRPAGKPDTVYSSRQSVRSPVNQRTMSPVRLVQAIQRPEPVYIRREKTPQSPIPKDSMPRNEHFKEEAKERLIMASEGPVSAKQPGTAHHRALSPNPGQISAQRQIIPRNQGTKPDRREDALGFYQDYRCSDFPTDNKQLPSSPSRMDCQDFAAKSPQPIYMKKQELQNQIYESRVAQECIYGQRMQKVEGSPDHRMSDPKQLSPSKKQTMQHLEAFYWQQKALEAQRKSMTSPTNVPPQQNQPQLAKIDIPEVREVVYWQQLKKLDEEQQRKIFEQNMMEARNDPEMRRNAPIPPAIRHGSSSSLSNTNSNSHPSEQIYWRSHQQQAKAQPVGKPPLGQKGQNQPVLVVRPQQADRLRKPEVIDGRLEVPRSKSVSPHFTRSDDRRSLSLPRKVLDADNIDDGGFAECNREKTAQNIAALRKPETPAAYEEDLEGDRKAPPPIFKRGSLISNSSSSVDYGTIGPKRVSFSNQSNCPEVGNWPTKHGMAPEPPTRKHKSENAPESVYYHEQEHQVYGNIPMRLPPGEHVALASHDVYGNRETLEKEYDANKPLPPPPRESSWSRSGVNAKDRIRNEKVNCNEYQRLTGPIANPRKWTGVCDSESGSEASEVQRIFQRRNEEEWNPDGKGRQSNDTGGGRVEGDQSSNEVVGGRRGVGTPGGGGSLLGGGGGSRGTPTGTGRSRDEPRRHTLSGDHQPSLHHQQFGTPQLHPLHPHHLPPPHSQYGTPPSRHTMDLESPLPRGYPPPSSAMLFDDDPGIMSEVETSSTGFRRGGKQRSSLPVVRTPSKTLERPLGLVFLQYRNETKRALLPNEITSIDTVKALFVRSFPKQLTMEYLDSPHVKVYIHDSNKDMFYELEDLRSHLRDIRDRSVLRLFESSDGVAGMPGPLGVPGGGGGIPPHWEDQSYFSEPEFDSEYQHQHIHKSKTAKNSTSSSAGYYIGSSSTLPRGGPLLRAYSPAASTVVPGPNATPTQPKPLSTPDRLHGESGYMSSPERCSGVGTGSGRYPTGPYSTGSSYEDPYYSQYSGTVTPVIDEEASDTELLEESYSLYGVKPPGRPPSGPPRSPFPPGAPTLPPVGQPYDATRIRVEHMERQLANLTGLVQKALTHAPHTGSSPRDYLQVPAGRDPYTRSAERDSRHKPTPPPKPAALAAGQYVYRDLALTPEMYNQLRGLQKKAKDLRQEVRNLRRMSQTQAHTVRETIRDTFITIRAMLLSGGDAAWAAGDAEKIRLSREEDLYKQEMIRLEKDLTELESTVEELRGNVINRKTRVNMSDVENMALILSKSSKTVADLKVRFPSLQEGMKGLLSSEMEKVVREEKFLKEEPERLESALRRCKKLTGTLVTLKRLASVQEQRLPNAASVEAEETPPITPTSAQHSKTAAPVPAERTVVGSTSVIGGGSHSGDTSTPHQQRPENALDALLDELQTFSRPASQLSQVSGMLPSHPATLAELGRSVSQVVQQQQRPPNISDIGRKGSVDSSTSLAIITGHSNTLRRLHSYPSSSDTDTSPPIARLQVSDGGNVPLQKPPVPERNAELLQLATARRVPPPPPPRTSSRSPLASPTSPQLPPRNPTGTLRRGRANPKNDSGKPPMALPANATGEEQQQQQQQQLQLQQVVPANNILSTSNSSSCESINSQEGLQNKKERQEQLEQRHQELLRKQKALQEQYARLQQLQRNASGLTTVPPAPPHLLKKTGSESNLLAKMGLALSTTSSGSLTSLTTTTKTQEQTLGTTTTTTAATSTTMTTTATSTTMMTATTTAANNSVSAATTAQTTTSKIYETDIL